MLKLSILLLVSALFVSQSDAWLLSNSWANLINFEVWNSRVGMVHLNRTECVFFRGEGILGCVGTGGNMVVHCPAVLNMTGLDQEMFGAFAVGVDSINEVNTATILHLFPNLVDYPTYMVSKLSLKGEPIQFCLHDSGLQVFGVRVTDSLCFANMLHHLKLWNTNQIFTVSSFEVVKPTAVRLAELFVV